MRLPSSRPARRPLARLAFSALLLGLAAGTSSARSTLRPTSLPSQEEGPRLVKVTETHDFGKVFPGDPLRHVFELRSGGTKPLVIHKIKPGCGCTVAEVWRLGEDGEKTAYKTGTPLPPGARISLETEFKPAERRGPQAKEVQIYSNDPKGVDSVIIKATIENFLFFNAKDIQFGRMSVREARRADEFLIRAFDYRPIGLHVDLNSIPEKMSAVLTPVEPPVDGKTVNWRLVVSLESGQAPGDYLRQLRLVTDVPNQLIPAVEGEPRSTYDAKVTVFATILGLVSAKPNFMSFGVIRPGQQMSKWVRINGNDPEMELATPTVKVLDAKSDATFEFASSFETKLHPVAGVKNAWDLELVVKELPDTLQGVFRGRLMVDFEDPEIAGLPVSFTGFHRPSSPGPQEPAPAPQEPAPGSR